LDQLAVLLRPLYTYENELVLCLHRYCIVSVGMYTNFISSNLFALARLEMSSPDCDTCCSDSLILYLFLSIRQI